MLFLTLALFLFHPFTHPFCRHSNSALKPFLPWPALRKGKTVLMEVTWGLTSTLVILPLVATTFDAAFYTPYMLPFGRQTVLRAQQV
jgi:hypothetical protein